GEWVPAMRMVTTSPANRETHCQHPSRRSTCPADMSDNATRTTVRHAERPRRSSHIVWAELDADPRTGRSRGLRDAVFPGPLARPTHDDEAPVSQWAAHRLAAAPWPRQPAAWRTDRQDRDHRVLTVTAADPVAVPRHAVPTVPVVAQPSGAERLPEFVAVIPAQRVPRVVEYRIGQL